MKIKKIEAQPQEVKKLRVAAYCRVSTDNDDQKESLEAQKAHYETWIKRHSNWDFAGIFYDFGITGTKADVRDGLQALMYECRIGRIDYVLTKSVSRFSRNTTDCLSLVRELLSYNIPVYFEKENLDTGSMESELILSIISGMAQDESESISKNVKWTVQKRIEAGKYKFGYPPYGYGRDENGMMVINPEEAKHVRQIFDWALSGIGTFKIAHMLEEQGVPTRRGSAWAASTVKGILTNEKYYGAAMFQKTYTDSSFQRHRNHGEADSYFVSGHHEAIVNEEEFHKVQEIIEMHIKEKCIVRGTGKYNNRYLFSGIITCGECGDTFKRQTISSGISWCCKTHLKNKAKCSMMFIHEEAFKAAFVTMLNKLVFGGKQVLYPYYEMLRITNSDENIQRIQEMKQELQRYAERKDTIRQLRAKGIIDSVVYNQEIGSIDKQCEELRSKITALQQSDASAVLSETEALLRFSDSARMQTEFSEQLFASFVERIIVYTRKSVGFKLKCGLTLKEELCTDTK